MGGQISRLRGLRPSATATVALLCCICPLAPILGRIATERLSPGVARFELARLPADVPYSDGTARQVTGRYVTSAGTFRAAFRGRPRQYIANVPAEAFTLLHGYARGHVTIVQYQHQLWDETVQVMGLEHGHKSEELRILHRDLNYKFVHARRFDIAAGPPFTWGRAATIGRTVLVLTATHIYNVTAAGPTGADVRGFLSSFSAPDVLVGSPLMRQSFDQDAEQTGLCLGALRADDPPRWNPGSPV
jgi:hypothetical protein